MTRIVLNPSPEDRRAWGPLAHVTADERRRILELPLGQRKYALSQVERELKAALKKQAGR